MSVRNQLWEPAVLEQWAAALRIPSMQRACMECSGPTRWGLSSYAKSLVRPRRVPRC